MEDLSYEIEIETGDTDTRFMVGLGPEFCTITIGDANDPDRDYDELVSLDIDDVDVLIEQLQTIREEMKNRDLGVKDDYNELLY